MLQHEMSEDDKVWTVVQPRLQIPPDCPSNRLNVHVQQFCASGKLMCNKLLATHFVY